MIKLEHIYWIAAYLDGEAYFSYKGTPHIEVSSIDEDLIMKFRGYANLRTIIHEIQARQYNHNNQFKIQISGSIAAQWMMTLYPLLCRRRKEAIKIILSKWRNSQILNENKTHCHNGHPLSGRNLVVDLNGGRRCRICKNNNHRRWKYGLTNSVTADA